MSVGVWSAKGIWNSRARWVMCRGLALEAEIVDVGVVIWEVHVLGRALYSARPNCVPSEMQFLREGNVVVGLVIWQQDVLGEALEIQLILCMDGDGGGIHISDRCKSKSTFSREALLELGVPSGSSKYFNFNIKKGP